MNFNKDKFASLLLQAKGERSINRFGEDVDISPAHISRLSRSKIDTPPSPETIYKLSLGARNGVTYNDLMLAAGHISTESSSTKTISESVQLDSEIEKQFIQIIVSELFQSNYEWSLEKKREKHFNPMITIRLKNSDYSTWFIELKSWASLHINNIYEIYGAIATLDLLFDTKFTIAVDSISAYETILSNPPKSLRANVFIMLVNFKEQKIVKEERICQY